MELLDQVGRLLTRWKRTDLVRLLKRSSCNLNVSDNYGGRLFSLLTTAEIYSPVEDYEKLEQLSQEDQALILKAFLAVNPPKDHGVEIRSIEFFLLTETLEQDVLTDEEIIKDIEAQRSLLIAVATGGPRIKDVNDEYKTRRERIREALKSRSLRDPNPYGDLWSWYGKWSSGDLPSYLSRRKYITELYEPTLRQLRNEYPVQTGGIFDEPTGWTRVDRGIGEIRERLANARTEEQYQAIGLLCREVLISLSNTVFDPSVHGTLDGVIPSETDFKRMIEAYLVRELTGSGNEAARRHAKASLDLANDLQHRRTAAFQDAALCAEATAAVVNLVAIISGQRNP